MSKVFGVPSGGAGFMLLLCLLACSLVCLFVCAVVVVAAFVVVDGVVVVVVVVVVFGVPQQTKQTIDNTPKHPNTNPDELPGAFLWVFMENNKSN